MSFQIPKLGSDKVWLASFDIGYKNLCFCIQEANIKNLSSIKKIPRSLQYNANGTPTDDQSEVLRQVCVATKTIICKNTDITNNRYLKTIDIEVFHTLTDLLDKYQDYWDNCSMFIIEKQMSFKGVYNVSALKLGQHCYSYFCFKYGRFKQVVEYPAYHKTCVFGCEKIKKVTKGGKVSYKAVDKPARKKWSIDKAFELLAEQDDFKMMSYIQSQKKKDDLADTILQAISAFYLTIVEKIDI